MKRIHLAPLTAIVGFVVLGLAIGLGPAKSQSPAPDVSTAGDPLAEWLYPGARSQATSNRDRLKAIPLQGVQLQTSDPIGDVYAFYRKKCDPTFVVNSSNAWRQNNQPTMLMTQFSPSGSSAGFFHSSRQEANVALMVVHQPQRTITIQISCDPAAKTATDILLFADEHETAH